MSQALVDVDAKHHPGWSVLGAVVYGRAGKLKHVVPKVSLRS